MKQFKKILAFVLAAMFVLVAFAGCGAGDKTDDATAAETAAADAPEATGEKLIMATNASFPPYEFKGDSGEIEGIDAEIAKAIAAKIGRELEIVDTEFGSIIGGVQTGKFDIGMAGMTVTDERKQSVNFSDTYAVGVQSVIVKEDSEVTDPDGLYDKMIGVQQDTTGHIYASEQFGDDFVAPYRTGNDAVQALVSGKVDAVIIDNEPAKSYVASNEGLKILDTSYAEEEYAICVAKENTALLDEINNALASLKASGTIDAIIAKYIAA